MTTDENLWCYIKTVHALLAIIAPKALSQHMITNARVEHLAAKLDYKMSPSAVLVSEVSTARSLVNPHLHYSVTQVGSTFVNLCLTM